MSGDSEQVIGKGWVVSVNTGPGGNPRYMRTGGDWLGEFGLNSDARAYAKHNKPHRALSILSVELLEHFQSLGYRVAPGLMGENVTSIGVDLGSVPDGAIVRFASGVEVRVSEQRKPCFQLDFLGEKLKEDAIGKSGILCATLKEGPIKPGMTFEVIAAG